MKAITYRMKDGSSRVVEYDENAPCIHCGLPVVTASMGGTVVCPWCDLGTCRLDPSHRVDTEFDQATGKLATARRHYERWHTKEAPQP